MDISNREREACRLVFRAFAHDQNKPTEEELARRRASMANIIFARAAAAEAAAAAAAGGGAGETKEPDMAIARAQWKKLVAATGADLSEEHERDNGQQERAAASTAAEQEQRASR